MANPGESTPLLSSKPMGSGSFDRKSAMVSFRRKSVKKLSIRQKSSLLREDSATTAAADTTAPTAAAGEEVHHVLLPTVSPSEGLAPLFPNGGIASYDGREYIPYREPSLVKSVPAFPPYTRKARHRSFYLWWTNVSCCCYSSWHMLYPVICVRLTHTLHIYQTNRSSVTGGKVPVYLSVLEGYTSTPSIQLLHRPFSYSIRKNVKQSRNYSNLPKTWDRVDNSVSLS